MTGPGRQRLDLLQRWFQAVISDPEGAEGGVRSSAAQALIPMGREDLASVILPSSRLDPVDRLSIYAGAYYARLLECLGKSFPVLKQTLGPDVFDRFGVEYLQRHPSRSYTLDLLGANFSRYLAETRPEADDAGEGPGWPDFLIDLATLEWAIDCVFDGPGVEGQSLLTPEMLQPLPPERFLEAKLHTVPCLQVFTFRFPVSAYFTAVRRAGEDAEVAIPEPSPEYVALLRREYVVRRHPLTHFEHELLRRIKDGAAIGDALEEAAAHTELDDDALARVLRDSFTGWAAAGFFSGFSLP